MVATGHVRKGAILGLDGSIWARSADLNVMRGLPPFANNWKLTADEIAPLVAAANNPQSVMGGSLKIGGEKYMVLRAEADCIYGRKVAPSALPF